MSRRGVSWEEREWESGVRRARTDDERCTGAYVGCSKVFSSLMGVFSSLTTLSRSSSESVSLTCVSLSGIVEEMDCAWE